MCLVVGSLSESAMPRSAPYLRLHSVPRIFDRMFGGELGQDWLGDVILAFVSITIEVRVNTNHLDLRRSVPSLLWIMVIEAALSLANETLISIKSKVHVQLFLGNARLFWWSWSEYKRVAFVLNVKVIFPVLKTSDTNTILSPLKYFSEFPKWREYNPHAAVK